MLKIAGQYKTSMTIANANQALFALANTQLAISSEVKMIGTRLRRRLSNIFHLNNALKGFGNLLAADGTLGDSQLSNCQSPRTQRWRRLISAV